MTTHVPLKNAQIRENDRTVLELAIELCYIFYQRTQGISNRGYGSVGRALA